MLCSPRLVSMELADRFFSCMSNDSVSHAMSAKPDYGGGKYCARLVVMIMMLMTMMMRT